MEPRYRFRLYILTTLVLMGLGVLLSRLYDFQIKRREAFQQLAPGAHTVSVREPGIRGEITDCNGEVLARNLRSYEVTFNLEEIARAYRLQRSGIPTLETLRPEKGMPRKHEEKDIVAIVNETIIKPLTIEPLSKFNLAKDYNAKGLRTHYKTHAGLVPYTYRTDLTYDQFAAFAEHSVELPGVNVDIKPQRIYPYGSLAGHILGYLKKWEKGDIPPDAARRYEHYLGDDKGVEGVESTMDEVLRGPEGVKTIVKDEKGRTMGVQDYVRPGYGSRVELTIDARKQYLVENVLRRVGRGAAVVMNVQTGEIVAMASVPDYDPNNFIPSISSEKFNAYRQNKSSPFTNRAITGFTPGSTFKIPTALSGALKGKGDSVFSCDGFVMYGNHRIGCWIYNQSRGSHGSLDVSKAIKCSCNPYFNKLANTIGSDAMVEGFEMVGLGKKTGVELPQEDPGIVPGSRWWKREYRVGATLTPALGAMLSIGQGDSSASPLQLCSIATCIANGGKYYRPRIIRRVIHPEKGVIVDNVPDLKVDLLKEGLKQADLDRIRKGMWMAVNEPGGTAGRAKLNDIVVAGKTGTAQTSDNGKKSHNSWTIAFAPFDQPKYAVAVLVQNGGSGGKVCGPLVHLILRGMFAADQGMKLPLGKMQEYGGNTDRIEELALPEDALAALDVHAEALGEDGEEAAETEESVPQVVTPTTPIDPNTPTPTITPQVDAEGTIPRAQPVPEEH